MTVHPASNYTLQSYGKVQSEIFWGSSSKGKEGRKGRYVALSEQLVKNSVKQPPLLQGGEPRAIFKTPQLLSLCKLTLWYESRRVVLGSEEEKQILEVACWQLQVAVLCLVHLCSAWGSEWSEADEKFSYV